MLTFKLITIVMDAETGFPGKKNCIKAFEPGRKPGLFGIDASKTQLNLNN
jgi:hypothetical protein